MSSFKVTENTIAGCAPNDDLFDGVLDFEAEAYESGLQEGIEAARDGDAFEEGRKAGYLRGFALGLEFGFLESVAELLVEKSSEQQLAKRSIKRQTEILTRSRDLPLENVESVDFDSELRDLRALYKQCGSSVGNFQRPKSQSVFESNMW